MVLTKAETWENFNARVRAEFPDFGCLNSTLSSHTLPLPPEIQTSLVILNSSWGGDLSADVIAQFNRQRWIRLKDVIPKCLLLAAREHLITLATKVNKGKDMSYPVHLPPLCMDATAAAAVWPCVRSEVDVTSAQEYWSTIVATTPLSWNIQMMWAVDPFIRALVLSPRIGDIVCRLMGCSAVRVYHDNCLFRVPGSQRSRWHCDDGPNGYMAMKERQVVTVWYPLQRTTPERGSLVFPTDAPGAALPTLNAWDVAQLSGCPTKEMTEEYDLFAAASLEAHDFLPDEGTYEVGDISIHYTDCFHCAGPNLTDAVRMIVAVTYFADGCTLRLGGVQKFCPGVAEGQPVNSRFNPVLPHCYGFREAESV